MDRRGRNGRRSIVSGNAAAGFTLLEALFIAGLVGVLLVVSIPQTTASLNRSRGLAAARYVASRVGVARAQAVARSANVALRFEAVNGGLRVDVFADGNGNGVRTEDIGTGVDPAIDGPVLLFELFPGVRVTLSESDTGGAPMPLGANRLLSFSAMGTATSGSVYVTGPDGTRWAVRVLGTTARTRVLRYDPPAGGWVQAF